MANLTIPSPAQLPPLPAYELSLVPPLVPPIPDKYLLLILPLVGYWITSGVFHIMDTYDLCAKYRLHTPVEILRRNRVSKADVLRDVITQQIVQTIFGVIIGYFEVQNVTGREEHDVALWAQRVRLAQRAVPSVFALFGLDASGLSAKAAGSGFGNIASVLSGGQYPELVKPVMVDGQSALAPAFAPWECLVAKAIFWIMIPALQFAAAIIILDTWQYFLHRAMHMNKYLYTTLHSRHHRLYVPYAYGALYNHPVEGFLLDSLGAGLAYMVTGMTARQGMWFFTGSSIKTVDDHCGYSLPWDPLQHLTGNNAGYHDIHHQSWGIKANFSQPFFTFWDRVLGTKWQGGDLSARYARDRANAERADARENDAILLKKKEARADFAEHGILDKEIDETVDDGENEADGENSAAMAVEESAKRVTRRRAASLKAIRENLDGRLRGRPTAEGGASHRLSAALS